MMGWKEHVKTYQIILQTKISHYAYADLVYIICIMLYFRLTILKI